MIKHLKPKTHKEVQALLGPKDSLRSWKVEAFMYDFFRSQSFVLCKDQKEVEKLITTEIKKKIKFDTSVSLAYSDKYCKDVICTISFWDGKNKMTEMKCLILI